MKIEDIKAFILSKIIIGKTYKLRSGYADTQDYRKKSMVPVEIYQHFILFRDEDGFMESFTYGELYGVLVGGKKSVNNGT